MAKRKRDEDEFATKNQKYSIVEKERLGKLCEEQDFKFNDSVIRRIATGRISF